MLSSADGLLRHSDSVLDHSEEQWAATRSKPAQTSGAATTVGSPTTVLLAAELGLLRHALEAVLSEQADIKVVAAVADNTTVPQVAQRMRPDVVVIDVDRPDGSMPATIHQLRTQLPRTPIVALLTARPTTLLRELLETGVVGVIDKNTPASRLVEAVRGAATGELVVDAKVAMAAVTTAPNPLTVRETEVLHLAAAGATGAEIAIRLRLAQGTVRNYLSNAFTKTGGRNRIEAVRIALDAGWLQRPLS